MSMLGRKPPNALLRYVKKRVAAFLGSNGARSESTAKIEMRVEAAIPLYRLRSNRVRDPSNMPSLVKSGSRLVVSQNSIMVLCDAIRNVDRYSSGLLVGGASQLWLDAVRGALDKQSQLVEVRLLQIQAIHTEYLWLHFQQGDEFLRFDKDKGIMERQTRDQLGVVLTHIGSAIRERIRKQGDISRPTSRERKLR